MTYDDDRRLSVNFPALLDASSQIQTAIHTLDRQLEELERAAAPLVTTWTGEAREAYQVRQANWRKASVQCTTILRSMLRALDESREDFRNTEHRNVRLFQG